MTVSIRLKHSSVAAKVPLPADLADGELGLNINDTTPAVYLKDSAGAVVQVGGQGTEPDATETVKGVLEIATQAEVDAGTDDTRAVTPLKLATAVPAATETVAGKAEIATQAEVTTGTDDTTIVTPLKLATSVPAASEVTAGKAEIATQAEVDAGTDDARIVTPLKAATTFVNVSGDTMTGDLTAPVVNATDHMEGVYSSQIFNVTGGPNTVTFDIPVWCNRIEIQFIDWYSAGTTKGADVAYWQFLTSAGTSYALNPVGSMYELHWGDGLIGRDKVLDNAGAEVYFIPFGQISQRGLLDIVMRDTLTTDNSFRCNFSVVGNYVDWSSGSRDTGMFLQSGIMLSANTFDRPARISLGSYTTAVVAPFMGNIKFYN